MKDYLYYLFDEKMGGDELLAVKEQIHAMGAKVIDLQPSKKTIAKKLKEVDGPCKYALLIGNTVEAQQAAQEAKVDFCGWLDGTTSEEAFKALPYRQLLTDIKLLPKLGRPFPYREIGKPGEYIQKYIRWVHFKQIRGVPHKSVMNIDVHICQNCGDEYVGNYCPTCGQTYKVKRFDLKNITKELIMNAIDLEHGFLRTFLELFWRPGYMMRDYLNGHRIDYSKPFKTIFVLATIYLIAAHLLDPASFVKQKEEPKLESVPGIVQKMAADTTNNDIVPQLFEINKLATEVIAIRREQSTQEALHLADSIMKSQRGSGLLMSKADSIMVMRQVMAGLNKADSVKLSQALTESLEDSDSKWASFARFAAKNSEVIEKFQEKYYHEGTLLYSMVDLVSDFMGMNKAAIIILMIPVMVFCARKSFRTTLVGMKTNLAEYIVMFTIFGGQQMWIQLFSLIATQSSDFTYSWGMDMGSCILILVWDLKQLFNLSWGDSFKRTILYMYGYSFVFGIILTFVLSILGSAVMWLLYQIT